MKFWAFEFVVADALEPVEVSLTVIVTMSPTFEALRSAKSEPLAGAQREPVGASDAGCGPASGKGSDFGLNTCFGALDEAAPALFDCIVAQPERIRTSRAAEMNRIAAAFPWAPGFILFRIFTPSPHTGQGGSAANG